MMFLSSSAGQGIDVNEAISIEAAVTGWNIESNVGPDEAQIVDAMPVVVVPLPRSCRDVSTSVMGHDYDDF